MFGTSTGRPTTSAGFGGSFGSNSGTGGSFGGFGTSTTQPQTGQTPATGGSLSINTGTPTTGGGTSLFGGGANTNQNQNQNTGGTSFFGNNANTQQPQPATTGGSLFGSNATGNTPGGGLFGNQQAAGSTAPTGSTLFGGSTTQPLKSLFGTGPSSTTQTQPGGMGMFSQTQPQNASSQPSLFGMQPPNQQPAQSTTSLFGQPPQQQQQQQQQPPQQQQSSLFGNLGQSTNTSTGGFGSGLFGNASTSAQPTTLLGSSNLFASRNTLGSTQMTNSADGAQAQFTSVVQRIEAVARAWDPNSPQCPFQYYFYNLVDRNQVNLYGRPPNAVDEARWQKAVRENPDPSCYVPALAVGFDDLQKRVDAQKQQSTAHQERIQDLKTRLSALTEKHYASHAPRLQRALAYQTQLMQRLTRLAQHLHLIIPSVRSSSIRPEEEGLRSTLEALEDEIRRPGGTGRLKAKLSELWALVGAMEAAKERTRKGDVDGNGRGWVVVDQEGLQRITEILTVQQNGLAHLMKIVQQQLDDLDIIYGQEPRNTEEDAFSNLQARQASMASSMTASRR